MIPIKVHDRIAIGNLFADWLESAGPIQLVAAQRFLTNQAQFRRYPGADEDLNKVSELVRRAMEGNGMEG